MEQQAPRSCRPRAVLSTALGSRALLCLLCALAAACWPAVAGAAPAPDPAPQAPAPAPDPAPGAGTTQPTQTPSSGTVTSTPAPPSTRRAEHDGHDHGGRHGRVGRDAAGDAATRAKAQRAKAHRAAVRRAKARHAAARREAVRRAHARRAAAQRARGASGTDPSAIARLTDLVPNTSTNDLSSTALLLRRGRTRRTPMRKRLIRLSRVTHVARSVALKRLVLAAGLARSRFCRRGCAACRRR